MITKEQALSLKHRDILCHASRPNVRCRVNGKCKTWKTRPDDFQLPVKAGLYYYGYITQSNAGDWNVG